jgi:hypothetical protein
MNNHPNTFTNGPFPPFGINDQNFNRQLFVQKNYDSGSSFDKFVPNNSSPQYFNINQKSSQTMIDKINYKNPGNLIHNNVSDNVLDEQITEYRIHIDSLDRDISVYPDPLHFAVKFNPTGRSNVRTEKYIDPHDKSKGTIIVNNYFESEPTPHIIKEFRNVKYIKLENISLPLFNKLSEINNEFVFDPSSKLIDDRFILLNIKELELERTYATYDSSTRTDPVTGKKYTSPKPFAIIYPDKTTSSHYFSGIPYYGSRVYKNSSLGNLSQMTINILDSCGLPIISENLATNDDIIDDGISLVDLRHPLNKKRQLHLSFLIGVVESQINNNTKFEK